MPCARRSLPQLFADAQKKAQTLAAAAGLKLGGVKGVNESSYASGYSGSWIGTSNFGGTFSSSTQRNGNAVHLQRQRLFQRGAVKGIR